MILQGTEKEKEEVDKRRGVKATELDFACITTTAENRMYSEIYAKSWDRREQDIAELH